MPLGTTLIADPNTLGNENPAIRKPQDDTTEAAIHLPLHTATAFRVHNNAAHKDGPISREIAGETPVSLTYNGLAYAVMMATPQDLEDFAVGFSLTQAAVERAEDIIEIEIHEAALGYVVRIQIPPERFKILAGRRRNVVGQTGCGMCGIVELDKALLPLTPVGAPKEITARAMFAALETMRSKQVLHEATGAMHGAAFFTPEGSLVALREDVGRHNAFDKLIGALLRSGVDLTAGFAALTSRCSYELVEKAVMAKIPVLATVSAPTHLAVERAREGGLTLISLARRDSALVFNDPSGCFRDNATENQTEDQPG